MQGLVGPDTRVVCDTMEAIWSGCVSSTPGKAREAAAGAFCECLCWLLTQVRGVNTGKLINSHQICRGKIHRLAMGGSILRGDWLCNGALYHAVNVLSYLAAMGPIQDTWEAYSLTKMRSCVLCGTQQIVCSRRF